MPLPNATWLLLMLILKVGWVPTDKCAKFSIPANHKRQKTFSKTPLTRPSASRWSSPRSRSWTSRSPSGPTWGTAAWSDTIIEIRLECRCLQKCFLIWNYYVGCLWAPLLFLRQSKETVFWSNLLFFTIKTRFWQYYS